MNLADTCRGAACPIDTTALFEWAYAHPEIILAGLVVLLIVGLIGGLLYLVGLWLERRQGDNATSKAGKETPG